MINKKLNIILVILILIISNKMFPDENQILKSMLIKKNPIIKEIFNSINFSIRKNTEASKTFYICTNNDYDTSTILKIEKNLLNNLKIMVPEITSVKEIIKNFNTPSIIILLEENRGYTHLTLKYGRIACYFGIGETLKEIRFEDSSLDYKIKKKIYLGAPMENIFEILGKPKKIEKQTAINWEDEVLYIDVNNQKGYGYIDYKKFGIRFFILGYNISSIYIYKEIKDNL